MLASHSRVATQARGARAPGRAFRHGVSLSLRRLGRPTGLNQTQTLESVAGQRCSAGVDIFNAITRNGLALRLEAVGVSIFPSLQAWCQVLLDVCASVWPYVLGALAVTAAVRAYDSWQIARARAARIAERKAKEIQKIKARFSAALIDDAGSQHWIPASAPRSVEELSRTAASHASLMSDATSAFRSLKAKKPKKLPLSTPFPAAMVWGQSGCVASISFRDTAPTSDWGFSMQDSVKLSAALASSTSVEASQPQSRASEDTDREVLLWDYNEEEDEEDETAYKEWRKFARNSKLDRVLDTWDHSQLQTERPVPECLERNF